MRRVHLLCGALLCAGTALFGAASGCTTTPTNTALRSLEQSGRVSFLCMSSPALRDPATDPPAVLPLNRCRGAFADLANDYGTEVNADGTAGTAGTAGSGGSAGTAGDAGSAGSGSAVASLPHLYALVTQTFRGEVAVVDLTTVGGDSVVDQDPGVPGPNFLPVGGAPIGIASTPGGTASFVSVAEVGREGIYAIPSKRIVRPCPREPQDVKGRLDPTLTPEQLAQCAGKNGGTQPAPELTSWPACALPAAPGEITIVMDPADELGNERASCDSDYEPPRTDSANGNLTSEGFGRQKLVVPLPSRGGIAIIDAQELLDRPSGSFDDCPVERWVLLDSEVPPIVVPEPPKANGCANPDLDAPQSVVGAPQPAGMALTNGTLFVADLALPLIHRLELQSPCEPKLSQPLLPFAFDEPDRVVKTERLAVTPQPTASLKRYLYATDVGAGTVMVFDISDGASTRTPMIRSHPEWTPNQPRDRIRFRSAPRDIIAVAHDTPRETKDTGVAPEGTFCDPDPNLKSCEDADPTCTPDVHTLYRTSSDYQNGAGPYVLRGTFAFVVLTNGEIEIVDIEDLDGDCRRPITYHPLLGCELPACTTPGSDECPANFECALDPQSAMPTCKQKADFVTSAESSCNVFTPNTVRSSVFIVDSSQVGRNAPGLGFFPLLFDATGGGYDTDDATAPSLRATLPRDGGLPLSVFVQDGLVAIDQFGTPSEKAATGDSDTEVANRNIVSLNLETPRALTVGESVAVVFEGPLPGFSAVSSELQVALGKANPERPDGVYEPGGRYCDGGVQSKAALMAAGVSSAEASELADRVQIGSLLAEEDNDYWDSAQADADNACDFELCKAAFGDGEQLLGNRDFVINEAYQDRLLLDDTTIKVTINGVDKTRKGLKLAKCCFPAFVTYAVRPGNQWLVVGQVSGFQHHTVADPDSGGACRPSCDPVKAQRQNGRAMRSSRAAGSAGVRDGDPTAFINQMLRFAVVDGKNTSCNSAESPAADCDRPLRDMQFRFSTGGAFSPFTIQLVKDSREVAPVGIAYVPPTGELAVTDGALQGLITVNLASVDSYRQFY